MQIFVISFLTMMVLNVSGICNTNGNQHDVLCNRPSIGHNSETSGKSRREAFSPESDSSDYEKRKINELEVDNLQRTKRNEQKKEIDLPPGYSIYDIPKLADRSPMPVFIHLNVSKILGWDELNENIEIDLELKIMWTDFQILAFHNNTHPGNGIPLIDALTYDEIKSNRLTDNNPALLQTIWKPNLFMEGLLSVKQPVLMSKPLTIRYIPKFGWFEYITRIQVKFDCSMNFQYYPADTQSCFLSIRGFSYTTADLNLTWYKAGVYLNDVDLQNFVARIDELVHFEMSKSDDPDEVYDVLGFKIVARRKLSYHLIQTYLASSFYIIITTLCFLLPSTMVEARIGMSMTTLLTLTAMFGAIRESTPIVSYTKAIDIWMVGCIFFVFLTLFQFTFSIWLKNVKKSDSKRNSESKAYEMDGPATIQSSESTDYLTPLGPVFSARTIKTFEIISKFLEGYSFPLFLTIFLGYSIGYWMWLLTASNYFNWNVNSTWNKV